MAIIKKHWNSPWTQLSLLLVLVAVVGVAYVGGGPAVGQSAEETRTVATDTYRGVQRLRRELHLSNRDMAAIGLSGTQVTAILSSLVEWYAANDAELAQREADRQQARVRVRRLSRQIHAGASSAQLIDSHRMQVDAFTAAVRGQQALLDRAASRVETQMTFAQREAWRQGRRGVGDAPFRYVPGLSFQELRRLQRPSNDQDRSITDSLSRDQQQALDTARENLRTRLEEVNAAEDAVLPPPSALTQHHEPDIATSN